MGSRGVRRRQRSPPLERASCLIALLYRQRRALCYGPVVQIFRVLWRLIRPILDEDTAGRVFILGASYAQTMSEAGTGAHALPDFLGGEHDLATHGLFAKAR